MKYLKYGKQYIRTFIILTAVFFVLMCVSELSAQPTDKEITKTERIESFVQEKMHERKIPAVSYAIVKDGKIYDQKAIGYASLELRVVATKDTVYQIASVTKTVTAVAVMHLIEKSHLSLTDKIGTHVAGLPTAWQSVTVRQLLQQTSGIPGMSVDQYTMKTVGTDRSEVLKILSEEPIMFEPGSKWSYNGTNFMLLEMLIENVSGLSYEKYVTDYILKGLQSTTFGGVQVVVPGRATHYTWFRFGGERPVQASEIEVLDFSLDPVGYGGGGLNISVSDFAQYIALLQRKEIISQSSLEEIWQPIILSDGEKFIQAEGAPYGTYGLGWIIDQNSTYPWVGGTGGLRSSYIWYPNEKLVIIVFTNLQGSGPEAIAHGIADVFREI